MSDDEGEKFFLHYWDFGEEPTQPTLQHEQLEYLNTSIVTHALEPAIALHTNHERPLLSLFGRNIFARDFQCPADTVSCGSTGSDLCCPSGQTCVSVSGGVGCCPSGESCGDTVGSCDTSAGYTSCPNSSNGGCCVPNAACEGTGCVVYGTQTITATLPVDTVTAGASYSTATDGTGTTTYAETMAASVDTSVLTSGYTTTVTVTQSLSGQMTTVILPTSVVVAPSSDTSVSAAPSGTLTCTAGFLSCAASLGGGCCPTGQICGTSNLCLDPVTSTTTSGATPGAPIRQTSVSSDPSSSVMSTAVSAATAASSSDDACPTGFYMCSAYYMGGCCRVNRNCDTTSCPSTDSTAIVSSGATVDVPYTSTNTVGDASATSQGSCANGWFSCAANAGGGCCPSGHICGASCTATASGESNTAKEAPSSASVTHWAWSFCVLALTAGIGMVWL